MKSLKLLALPFLLLCVLAIQSCEKDESIVAPEEIHLEDDIDCFYTNDCIELSLRKRPKKSEENLTKAVKQWFKKNKNKKERFKDKVGTPIWKENYRYETETYDIVYIPVAQKDNEETKGVLIAAREKGKKKITYKTIKRRNIGNYRSEKKIEKLGSELSLEHVITQFMIFDYELFDFTDCGMINLLKKQGGAKNCVRERVRIYTEYFQVDKDGENRKYLYTKFSHYEYRNICTGDDPLNRNNYANEDSSGGNGDAADGGGGSGGGTTITDPCADGYTGDVACLDRDDCGPGKVKDANGACVDEDNIIIEIDNPKFDCVYSQFIQGANSLFNSTIKPFHNSQVNLVFKSYEQLPSSGRCSDGKGDGCTSISNISNNEITIYIANPSGNALDLAATILHEGLHASIAAFVQNKGVDVRLLNTTRLLELYDYYNGDASSADHYHMTETYINPLAGALRSLDGNRLPLSKYKPFAWDGLRIYGEQIGLSKEQMYETNTDRDNTLNTFKLCED